MSFLEVLTPDQKDHLAKILKILSEFPFAFDTSPLGSGKTFIAGAVAEAWKYKNIVVVCPATVEKVWHDVLKPCAPTRPKTLETYTIISYEGLRGSQTSLGSSLSTAKMSHVSSPRNGSPKKKGNKNGKEKNDHPISRPDLTAITTISSSTKSSENGGDQDGIILKHGLLAVPFTSKNVYYATEKLKNDLRTGTLFVFDESHRAKNESSSTHAAVGVIVREIIGNGGWSRALMLSGTLFDKTEHAISLARLIGAITMTSIAIQNKYGNLSLTGVLELIRWIARVVEKHEKDAPLPDYGQKLIHNKYEAKMFVYTLMTEIILVKTSAAMKPPRIEVRKLSPTAASRKCKTFLNKESDIEHGVNCEPSDPNIFFGENGGDEVVDDVDGTIDCGNLAVYLAGKNKENFIIAVSKLAKLLAYDRDRETVSFKSIRKFGARGIGALKVAIEGSDGDHPSQVLLRPLRSKESPRLIPKREGVALPHKLPPETKILEDGTIVFGDLFKSTDPVLAEVQMESTFGNIMLLLHQIESSKLSVIISLVKQQLSLHPNYKIIVALNFLDSINRVTQEVREFMESSPSLYESEIDKLLGVKNGISIVTGSTSKMSRNKIFSKFQEPNTQIRVLVASINVISLGISLDDQSKGGIFRRIIYASPNYYAINQHQLVRRVFRRNTTSQPIVRFIYGANPVGQEIENIPMIASSPKTLPRNNKLSPTSSTITSNSSVIYERGILKALHRKSKVLRSTIRNQDVVSQILFADEYPEEFISEQDVIYH